MPDISTTSLGQNCREGQDEEADREAHSAHMRSILSLDKVPNPNAYLAYPQKVFSDKGLLQGKNWSPARRVAERRMPAARRQAVVPVSASPRPNP